MLYNRYEKEQKYINGTPASPAEYRKGDYLGQYEFNSIEDCENTEMYRWVETDKTVCSSYSLCVEEKKQVSYDDGQTWQDTTERRAGRVIKERAEECGWRVLERWELVGTTCLGFDAVHQYIKQYSYDMGATWENSDPPEYKYSAKEEFSEECVLASEPLTFEVTINSPNTLVHINVNEKVYKYVDLDLDNYQAWIRYYIDYGVDQGPQYIEFNKKYNDNISGGSAVHIVKEVKCKDFGYVSPGVYTIKIWGLHSTINGLSTNNEGDMSYKVTSWGSFTGDVEINEDYTSIKDITYKMYPSLKLVRLEGNQITAICNDSHSAFGGLVEHPVSSVYNGLQQFIVSNCPNIAELPSGLLTHARAMRGFKFSGTSISAIPPSLFENTNKLTYLYRGFSKSKNLTSVPDELFTPFKATALTPETAINLGRCFQDCTALVTCNIQDIHISCGYTFKNCTSLTGPGFTNCTIDYGSTVGLPSSEFDKGDNEGGHTLSYYGVYDCRYCFYNCTSLNVNPLQNSHLGTIQSSHISNFSAEGMFAYSSVPTFDISFFDKALNLTQCFYKCPNIAITGAFQPYENSSPVTTMEGYDLTDFLRESGIVTLGNIFANVTDGVNFPHGCYNCEALTTIDRLLFTNFKSYQSIYQCFAYCHNLTSSAPKNASGTDIWNIYTFITDGKYDLTLAFQGSYNMANFSSIPSEWGGAVLPDPNLKPVILELTGEIVYLPLFGKGWIEWGDDPYMDYEDFDNHIYMEENYQDWDYSQWLVKDCINHTYTDGLTTHTVKAYFDTYSILSLRFTTGAYPNTVTHDSGESTTKIISFGSGLYDTDYKSIPIKGVEQIPGHQEIRAGSVNPITKLKQLSNLTFLGKDEGALRTFTNADSWAVEMNKLEGIDPDFLASAANLNSVRNLFSYCTKLKSIPDGFLSKNTLLTDIYGMCFECSSLTTIPTDFLSTCKQIQNFGSAFRDCPELTGNTPVNDDGTKWWERKGKEGYPDSISSTVCFQGCTKLNDYNDIPMSWR